MTSDEYVKVVVQPGSATPVVALACCAVLDPGRGGGVRCWLLDLAREAWRELPPIPCGTERVRLGDVKLWVVPERVREGGTAHQRFKLLALALENDGRVPHQSLWEVSFSVASASSSFGSACDGGTGGGGGWIGTADRDETWRRLSSLQGSHHSCYADSRTSMNQLLEACGRRPRGGGGGCGAHGRRWSWGSAAAAPAGLGTPVASSPPLLHGHMVMNLGTKVEEAPAADWERHATSLVAAARRFHSCRGSELVSGAFAFGHRRRRGGDGAAANAGPGLCLYQLEEEEEEGSSTGGGKSAYWNCLFSGQLPPLDDDQLTPDGGFCVLGAHAHIVGEDAGLFISVDLLFPAAFSDEEHAASRSETQNTRTAAGAHATTT